jgi:hypothetical protein
MKKTVFVLSIAFLTSCAAPPPVKIASKLLGRTLLKEAKGDTQNSDTNSTTAPQ